MKLVKVFVALCLVGMFFLVVVGQNPQGARGAAPGPATLGLEEGTLDFDTPDFSLKLVRASQTVAALQPKGSNGFDFTPADRLESRAGDRFNSLGDITFRVSVGNSGIWQEYSTSGARHPVEALIATPPVFGTYRIKETFVTERGASTIPLKQTTRWIEITDEVR